jgi:hypothetical protein
MTIELIIAILLFFGVSTSEELSKLNETETKHLYEQQDLNDASFIEDWNGKVD